MSAISRRTLIAIILAVAGGILVASTAAITYVIMHDTRQDISLADIASSDWRPDPPPLILEGMDEKTDSLCAGIEGCIEGYEADHASFYRFGSRPDAAAFARETPNAYQSDWIVIHFTDDDLTSEEKKNARQMFDELAVSD